jgi:hypothetical protein
VIGVGGVYTINTENVTGNVWITERILLVDGLPTTYLPAAVHEANDVSRRRTKRGISVPVRPVLAFIRKPTIKAMPTDLSVLDDANIRQWLEAQPRVMTPQQAYAIVLIANAPRPGARESRRHNP